MTDFNEKQIKVLVGSFSRIAALIGCTPRYVSMIIHGQRKSNSKVAKAVKEKAKEILEVLMPGKQE
ncbi:MAG: hypothetical protein AB2L24_27305 [Mangrovibacterium sp.]